MISWADTERDLSAWLGNAMQNNALLETYKLEKPIKDRLARGDEGRMTHAEGRGGPATCSPTGAASPPATTSTTCAPSTGRDGDVHKYFSRYDSPYDSYINFMNVLDNVRTRATGVVVPNPSARTSAAQKEEGRCNAHRPLPVVLQQRTARCR